MMVPNGGKGTRVTDALQMLFTMFLLFLPILPVVDLVDQTRLVHSDGSSNKHTGTITVMGRNYPPPPPVSPGGGGNGGAPQSLHILHHNTSNQIKFNAVAGGEMRDDTRNRGTGTIVTSGNWNSISQRQKQEKHLADMKDASSSSHSQSLLAFPNAFDMFPGLSSSSSSGTAEDSSSYEEELEEEERRIVIHPTKQKPEKQQQQQQKRHHLHAQQHLLEEQNAAALKRKEEGKAAPALSSSSTFAHSSSSRRLRGESNKKQVAFLVEPPPVPLASSTRVTGPFFDSNQTTLHISAKAGQNVVLDCTVILLQGRTVSWLRRGNDSLQLLTVGNITYYNDPRLGLRFRYPNNWRLGIDSVNKGDEGEYQCQLSSHPVKTLIYHLKVIAPDVVILDENGHSVSERHYKVDSSLHLTCRASHVDKFVDKVVWQKGDRPLSATDNRIKIKITKDEEIDEMSIHLSILSLHRGDSGNYSCRAGSLAKYTVTVHVVNGELPAAVQHESGATRLLLSPATICSSLLMSGAYTLVSLMRKLDFFFLR